MARFVAPTRPDPGIFSKAADDPIVKIRGLHGSPVKPIVAHRVEVGADVAPVIDAFELCLPRLFLRRYVTCCVVHLRFAAMEGAAQLRRHMCAIRWTSDEVTAFILSSRPSG
jgi:hypothetical protein